jgi:hypothetical protein
MTRVAIAALLILVATPGGAQTTVVLRLRVIAAAEGEPLRRARVVPNGDSNPQPVFSGDDGVVSVTARAGTDLRVSRAGYAAQLLRVPGTAATVDVSLPRAAVITGRVVDSNGAPGVRIGVAVVRLEPRDAATPAQLQLRTDDRGEFRAGGLVAGSYQVYTERGLDMTAVLDDLPPGGAPAALAARVRQGRESASNIVTVTPSAGEHADVTLTHAAPSIEFPFSEGGVVSGALIDEFGEPVEGARVTLLATGTTGLGHMNGSAVTDDLGGFRLYQVPPGRYLLVVTEANSSGALAGIYVPGLGDAASKSLPVYYPGTYNPAEAVAIAVDRGRELAGMDMVVRGARGVRVFGTVTPIAGTTQRPVSLKPSVPWTIIALGNRSSTVRPDGSFELTDVPPGEYAVQALAAEPTDRGGQPTDFRFAAVRIVVGSDDVGPVVLTPAPTSSISGRITLEGGRDGVSANQFRLAVLPLDPAEAPEPFQIGDGLRIGPGGIVPVGNEPELDWTFRINGLSGPTRFGLARAPQGWWLKEVRIGGRNAAYEPAPFGAPEDSRNNVEIVLSNRGGTIGGRVTDGDNKPVDLYTVIAFPTDRDRWFSGSSLVKTTTSSSDGTFVLPSLAPGDYLLAAVEFSELDPNADDLMQPDGLARLAPSARRVTVAENQRQRVDMKLTPLAR